MKRNILLSNRYAGEPFEIIKKLVPKGFQLLMIDQITEDALRKSIHLADYLLVSGRVRITEETLLAAEKLKMIQRTGVGLDTLDLAAIKKRNIPLYVNQGVNSESVAEHALLLILACLRRLTEIDRNTKSGIWKKQVQGVRTHELKGKTVGIIGMGNIAQRLVSLLTPFEVAILYYDKKRVSAEYEIAHNLKYATLEQLYCEADIITIHCALTDETKGMINQPSIEHMKNGVILVNTARGAIIETAALAEGLKSGKISFAGIDVHEYEPINEDYLLKGINNVILTPHISGITYESFSEMMQKAMNNIEKYEYGQLDKIQQYRYL